MNLIDKTKLDIRNQKPIQCGLARSISKWLWVPLGHRTDSVSELWLSEAAAHHTRGKTAASDGCWNKAAPKASCVTAGRCCWAEGDSQQHQSTTKTIRAVVRDRDAFCPHPLICLSLQAVWAQQQNVTCAWFLLLYGTHASKLSRFYFT